MDKLVIKDLVTKERYSLKCPFVMKHKYHIVHNTANDATARAEIGYMLYNMYSTSFHYAIDDKQIVQGIPTDRNAWHAGDGQNGKGNREGVSYEICYSKSGGKRFEDAEKLTAKFIASNLHQEGSSIDKVRKHQDFSGKYCPHRTLDLGWRRFLDMIQRELDLLNTTGNKVKVKIDSKSYEFEGFIKDGTNYVQIREVFEALGYKVGWENSTKEVIIKSNK